MCIPNYFSNGNTLFILSNEDDIYYYTEGYDAAIAGKTLDDNPHKESGHERDTTFEDEAHFRWYQGWCDYRE